MNRRDKQELLGLDPAADDPVVCEDCDQGAHRPSELVTCVDCGKHGLCPELAACCRKCGQAMCGKCYDSLYLCNTCCNDICEAERAVAELPANGLATTDGVMDGAGDTRFITTTGSNCATTNNPAKVG